MSRSRVITGIVISWICILFLLFDAITKIFRERHTIEASQHIGWPVETLQPIGVVLLICTLLYIFRRTAVLGAVLLTAWLGGGTAICIRSGVPWYFPVVFGILLWLGLWLRDDRLGQHLPIRKD
jgi:hypothetical protein